jgi:hypothetical protein
MCFLCAKRGLLLSSATNHPAGVKKKSLLPPGATSSADNAFSAPTFKITEVDEHLKWNPHIWSGYRQNYTFAQCLCSFFTIHNETGSPSLFLILIMQY